MLPAQPTAGRGWKGGTLDGRRKEVVFPAVTQTRNHGLVNAQSLRLSGPPSSRLLPAII